MKKKIYVYSLKLAAILIEYGYEPIEIVPNVFYPKYKVFVFDNCEVVQAIVDKYTQDNKVQR